MAPLNIVKIHPDDMQAMRIRCGLTQHQLAEVAQVTLVDVERWESLEFTKSDLDYPELGEAKFRVWKVFRSYGYSMGAGGFIVAPLKPRPRHRIEPDQPE